MKGNINLVSNFCGQFHEDKKTEIITDGERDEGVNDTEFSRSPLCQLVKFRIL